MLKLSIRFSDILIIFGSALLLLSFFDLFDWSNFIFFSGILISCLGIYLNKSKFQ